jgi:polygalacturonase
MQRAIILNIAALLVILLVLFTGYQKTSTKEPFPFEFTPPAPIDFPGKRYSITDYNAVAGDSIRDDKAIEAAINDCHKHGGGIVEVPVGRFLTGPITLRSNVNLFLAPGSELSFSNHKQDYLPAVFTRWEGMECMNYHPLIYARDCENIAISGFGQLTGNGESWWPDAHKQKETLTLLYDMVSNGTKPEKRILATKKKESFLRPSFIQFMNCRNVEVSSVSIINGPMWTVHFVYCEDVLVHDLYISARGRNNDGVIPDASKNVWINNCYFSTGDDCVSIKSGLNEDGWRVGKASENIVVQNCVTNDGHGGVVIGSEMSGGVRNVFVQNCTFNNMETGIRIKSMRGRGGYVKNIFIEDIDMNNIKLDAIKISMNYRSSSIEPRTTQPPVYKNIRFKDITCVNAGYAISIKGLPEQKIEELYFENVKIHANTGVYIGEANGIYIDRLNLQLTDNTPFIVNNSRKITLDSILIRSPETIFYKIMGKETEHIVFRKEEFDVLKKIIFEDGAHIDMLSLK